MNRLIHCRLSPLLLKMVNSSNIRMIGDAQCRSNLNSRMPILDELTRIISDCVSFDHRLLVAEEDIRANLKGNAILVKISGTYDINEVGRWGRIR